MKHELPYHGIMVKTCKRGEIIAKIRKKPSENTLWGGDNLKSLGVYSKIGFGIMSVGFSCLDLLSVEFLAVNFSPRVNGVGEDKGNEQTDVCHGAKRELTGTGVSDGKR